MLKIKKIEKGRLVLEDIINNCLCKQSYIYKNGFFGVANFKGDILPESKKTSLKSLINGFYTFFSKGV